MGIEQKQRDLRNWGGKTGEYFNNATLAGPPALLRGDPEINFVWAAGTRPASGFVGASNYSVRWIREIELSTTRKWTFTTTNDDGIRVWVDDRITIDAWYDHPAALFSATRWLAAGAHKVHVEYYDRMVSAMVVLPV